MATPEKLLRRIKTMIVFFIIALVISGVTAFPVYSELNLMHHMHLFSYKTSLGRWLLKVWWGVRNTYSSYRFLFYGYDWLAFAHLVIAMAFLGPYKDPVRNKWVIEWGMLACAAVLPLAIIAGPIRGIPWFHIVIDCLFGVIGFIPLWITKKWIDQLEVVLKVDTK
jgi:hypothetical protein